jgi:hypothetical protein
MKPIKVVPTTTASDFLLQTTNIDKLQATSTDEEQHPLPHLAYLRVEMTRLRTGMSDFLFKASAEGRRNVKPTVVTLRAGKDFAKLDGCVSAAKVLFKEMDKRNDTTFKWEEADPEYLAKMIVNHCKFFVVNPNISTMAFTTDALH